MKSSESNISPNMSSLKTQREEIFIYSFERSFEAELKWDYSVICGSTDIILQTLSAFIHRFKYLVVLNVAETPAIKANNTGEAHLMYYDCFHSAPHEQQWK